MEIESVVFLLVLSVSSICANVCPSESERNESDIRVKNTYRPTYFSSKNMRKMDKPRSSYTHFGKLRLKYKKLASRIRSLEQPVWLFSKSSERWGNDCTRICSCFFDKRIISCWRRNLKTIPSEQIVPYDVKIVDLGMNYMKTLHKDTFRALVDVEEIDLSYNRLNYLPTTVFFGLESLSKLKLNGNRLENISNKILYGLHRLRIIDLSENSLKRLPNSLFQWTSNLVDLLINKNLLETISANTFHGLVHLEELDLSQNRLCNLDRDTFHGLLSLKFLRMDENKFIKFTEGLFEDNKDLNIISMRKNQVINISTLVQNLSSLEYLDLALNNIAEVNGDELANVTALKELNLHHNRIRKLNVEVFRHTKYVQKLILSANYLTELHLNKTRLEYLTYVDLQYNMLKQVHEDIFKKWSNLSVILLQGNVLRNISPGTLNLMSNLSIVTLSHNMWVCDCGILSLSRWLRIDRKKILDFDNIKCSEPYYRRDELVYSLELNDTCDQYD